MVAKREADSALFAEFNPWQKENLAISSSPSWFLIQALGREKTVMH